METTSNPEAAISARSDEEKIPMFKKLRAKICDNCPLCNHARKNPDSRMGKILYHKYHADNCPFWKAYQEMYGDD